MAFKNGYRLWDDEFKSEYWTPKEIAASNAKVAQIGEIINAERNGEISHDEAMIRHLILDPDLAEIMLDDALNDGNIRETRKVLWRINQAKARTSNNPPSSDYWKDVAEKANETTKSGLNIHEAISQLNKALNILKAAVPQNITLHDLNAVGVSLWCALMPVFRK